MSGEPHVVEIVFFLHEIAKIASTAKITTYCNSFNHLNGLRTRAHELPRYNLSMCLEIFISIGVPTSASDR